MRLVVAKGDKLGKWYVLIGKTKRWITSLEAVNQIGLSSTDLEYVSDEALDGYDVGPVICKIVKRIKKCEGASEARAFLTKDLQGYGVEFGASANPTPVPLGCQVAYADLFLSDDESNAYLSGEQSDFVPVTFRTGFQDMVGIENNSLDFIINCHVIEHVSETVRALQTAYQKLRSGGVLFMAVPHMDYTFDANRRLTPLAHFVDDYLHYTKYKDVMHIMESWLTIQPEVSGRDLLLRCEAFLEGEALDCHYHTFTETNFSELVQWFQQNVHPWQQAEIINRIPYPGSNEFYVRLTK